MQQLYLFLCFAATLFYLQQLFNLPSVMAATHEVAPDALPYSGQEYEQFSTSKSDFVALVSKLRYLHTRQKVNLNGLETLST